MSPNPDKRKKRLKGEEEERNAVRALQQRIEERFIRSICRTKGARGKRGASRPIKQKGSRRKKGEELAPKRLKTRSIHRCRGEREEKTSFKRK